MTPNRTHRPQRGAAHPRLVHFVGDDGVEVSFAVQQRLGICRMPGPDAASRGFVEYAAFLLPDGRITLLRHCGDFAPPRDLYQAQTFDSIDEAIAALPAAHRRTLEASIRAGMAWHLRFRVEHVMRVRRHGGGPFR